MKIRETEINRWTKTQTGMTHKTNENVKCKCREREKKKSGKHVFGENPLGAKIL